MSMEAALKHVLKVLRTSTVLAFVDDAKIAVGDRKHDDDMVRYAINVLPFNERGAYPTLGADGEEERYFRIHITLFNRAIDSEERLLGTPEFPSISEFVERVKAVLIDDYKYSPLVQDVNFESTEYREFPPPKAEMVMVYCEAALRKQVADPKPEMWRPRQILGQVIP